MKQANLYFNYEICKQLHDEYRHLHNNSYVMLGDLHYFFYFTPCNFELYGLLLSICDKSIVDIWKIDGGNARSQGLIAMRRRNGACYYSALFLQIHFIFPLIPLNPV